MVPTYYILHTAFTLHTVYGTYEESYQLRTGMLYITTRDPVRYYRLYTKEWVYLGTMLFYIVLSITVSPFRGWYTSEYRQPIDSIMVLGS